MTFRPGAQFLLAKNVIMFGGYYVIGLQSAVESNFAVVGECLKNDYGVAQQELDDLLKEIHILNEKEMMVLMDVLNFIAQIGNQTYENFTKENLSNGRYSIDEDSLDHRRISVSDDDLIIEFDRKSNLLFSVEVNDLNGKVFRLPDPFSSVLSRSQVQSLFGDPIYSVPPKKILSIQTGWVEQYSWSDEKSLSVLVYYTYESEVINGINLYANLWG